MRAGSKNYRGRDRRGSVLVLIAAITLGLMLALLFFAFNYVRLIGAHEQQRTAMEAATLAAASDLTNIVIDDPNFGYVSLSDKVPNGKATTAGDNYGLPVIGINTLLATVRLDCIIADQFGDPIMQQLAQRDYTNAMNAKDNLKAALQAAADGGTGYDADGNPLNPINDAITAYNANAVRMMGANRSALVPNSMKMKLGCITNEPTSTPIPSPGRFAQMETAQQQGGYYLPYINVPYKNKDFVFAATASDVHLVDSKAVRETVSGLPYQIPSIAICEADELYKYTDNNGVESQHIIHAKCCAEPACMLDTMRFPGALELAFPNGRPTVFQKLGYLTTSDTMTTNPTDYIVTPVDNDAPPTTMNNFEIIPNSGEHPNFGTIIRVALYDWIRRARTKPDLQKLADGFSRDLSESESPTSPHSIFVEFAPDGSIGFRSEPIDPGKYNAVSHKQYFAASGLAIRNGTNVYDVFVKDYCYKLGKSAGGRHAGQPFGIDGGTQPPSTIIAGQDWINQNVTSIEEFPTGSGAGTIRPTYDKPGTAVEITVRTRS